jgi:thiol-disulfide isomerase/thioredoxin
MRKIIVLFTLAVLAVIAGTALGSDSLAPLSTPELRKVIRAGNRNTIIFFQNPQGGPCRAQNEILQRLLKDRKNAFNIAPVSTMSAGDQKAFYDYGVRSLPTIVLVDNKGVIVRFFPPGIQSYETLAAALDSVK